MLFQDIALKCFALPIGAYESGVGKDDGPNADAELARCGSRGHPAHRMPKKDRLGKSELFD